MMKVLCLLLAYVACAYAQVDDLPVIEEIDIDMYYGRWFQSHASPAMIATFEKDGLCITATYGPYNDTTITVFNHMRLFEPNGTADFVDAFGFLTNETGKLEINFFGTDSGGAAYWIMKLGPVHEYDGVEQYSYSIVSEPNRIALFILCRDPDQFYDLYVDEVLQYVKENGFNTPLNNPVETYLGDDCLYAGDEEDDML